MSVTDQLEDLIAEFERRGGSIPRVDTVDTLFAEYVQLAKEHAVPVMSLPVYVLALAVLGCTPVRMPDGTLGFISYGSNVEPVPPVQTRQ